MIAVLAIAFFQLAVVIGAIRILADAGLFRNPFAAAGTNIMFHFLNEFVLPRPLVIFYNILYLEQIL